MTFFGQSVLELYYCGYFLVNIILTIIFYIGEKSSFINNKRQYRKNFKILIVIVMFIFLIIGSLISEFTKNIVSQVPLIVLGALLFYTVIIEKGRIVKFLNAEIKYDAIEDTVKYLDDIFNKNEMSSNIIKYACSFKDDPKDLEPHNLNEAFALLEVLVEDYINKYNLSIFEGDKIYNNSKLFVELEYMFKNKKIWYNDDIVKKVANSLLRDEIVKVSDQLYVVPLIGGTFNQYVWIEGNGLVDIIDATFIKNIGRIVY